MSASRPPGSRSTAKEEAAAVPDEQVRAALVATALQERPAGEPLHITLRRAAHAVVQRDLAAREAVAGALAVFAREPALAAYAARGQARNAEQLSGLVAVQTSTWWRVFGLRLPGAAPRASP